MVVMGFVLVATERGKEMKKERERLDLIGMAKKTDALLELASGGSGSADSVSVVAGSNLKFFKTFHSYSPVKTQKECVQQAVSAAEEYSGENVFGVRQQLEVA